MSRTHALLLCMCASVVGALLGYQAGKVSGWHATAERPEQEHTTASGHLRQAPPPATLPAAKTAASSAQQPEEKTSGGQPDHDLPRDLGVAMDAEEVHWADADPQAVNIGPDLDVDQPDG